MDQNVEIEFLYQLLQVALLLAVAVDDHDSPSVHIGEYIRRHDGGVENELVHVGIAVAFGDQDGYLQLVDQGCQAGSIISFRKGVPCPMIKYIARVENQIDPLKGPGQDFLKFFTEPWVSLTSPIFTAALFPYRKDRFFGEDPRRPVPFRRSESGIPGFCP